VVEVLVADDAAGEADDGQLAVAVDGVTGDGEGAV
jgi:hypothetical protein